MPVLVSHASALEFWRSVPTQLELSTVVDDSLSAEKYSTTARDLAEFDATDYGITRKPLHVLGGRNVRRSVAADVQPHTCALDNLPENTLHAIAPRTYVCGPELTFALMARPLGELAAAVLGFELCGDYSHFAAPVSGFYDRPALTDTARLAATLKNLRGLYGLSAAKSALKLVLDGSRSPMETVLACMLSFPARLGGLSFETPRLNFEVRLDGAASQLAGLSRCRIDLAWPDQKVGFEYNGAAYHQDTERDRRRAEALRRMGWSIFTINIVQITRYSELARYVALIEGTVPHRPDGRAPTYAAKVLLDRLLGLTRFGWGMNSLLFGVPVQAGAVTVHL